MFLSNGSSICSHLSNHNFCAWIPDYQFWLRDNIFTKSKKIRFSSFFMTSSFQSLFRIYWSPNNSKSFCPISGVHSSLSCIQGSVHPWRKRCLFSFSRLSSERSLPSETAQLASRCATVRIPGITVDTAGWLRQNLSARAGKMEQSTVRNDFSASTRRATSFRRSEVNQSFRQSSWLNL